MAIKITDLREPDKSIEPRDMLEGTAYRDEDGIIYIGNHYDDIRGFSTCGKYILFDRTTIRLYPVDMEITLR